MKIFSDNLLSVKKLLSIFILSYLIRFFFRQKSKNKFQMGRKNIKELNNCRTRNNKQRKIK
jgi:hypothetical protein